mgnify:CR=1 FL=1
MKKVLVTPLDWGLGHATRCIPVVRMLLDRNIQVMLAGDGDSLLLLKDEFPTLPAFSLPGYRPVYPSGGSMARKMIFQLPKFFQAARREHTEIERIVRDNGIDVVISDNRYGCWSSTAYSVLITHQSNVLMPRKFGWLSSLVRKAISGRINSFDICWIPDLPDHRLSGILTSFGESTISVPVVHIGPVSRLKRITNTKIQYDVAVILSGPEPQRTIFESVLMPQLEKSGLRYFVARGLPAAGITKDGHCANFLNSAAMETLLASSDIVIARSGYSTIMDLARMGKKAVLVPTPGQTEQEYLARELTNKMIAFSQDQGNFDLQTAIIDSKKYSGFRDFPATNELLNLAVSQLPV